MRFKYLALGLLISIFSVNATTLELPLKLTEKTFDFKAQGLEMRLKVPSNMHETYIMNPALESYTYSTKENRLSISLQLINPSGKTYQEIIAGKFQELILKPFSDKENQLYGQVDIIRDEHKGVDKTFEYKGFLKKPQDGFTTDLYSMIHEMILLRHKSIIKLNCVVQGRQNETSMTKELFHSVEKSCDEILNSLDVKVKANK